MVSGNKLFGKKLKELRELKGYTQEQLAEVVNLEYQTISRIETGYYFTGYENLSKLADALGVKIKDLFEYEPEFSNDELINIIISLVRNLNTSELKFIFKTITNLKKIKK